MLDCEMYSLVYYCITVISEFTNTDQISVDVNGSTAESLTR